MTEYNSAGAHLSRMGSHMRYYYVCSKARKAISVEQPGVDLKRSFRSARKPRIIFYGRRQRNDSSINEINPRVQKAVHSCTASGIDGGYHGMHHSVCGSPSDQPDQGRMRSWNDHPLRHDSYRDGGALSVLRSGSGIQLRNGFLWIRKKSAKGHVLPDSDLLIREHW